MENSTQIVSFILTPYIKIGHIRYWCFTLLIIVYMSIICANTLLIGVICVERTLHEPMYWFLCSLFVNGLCGSTASLPFIMTQLFSETHEVSLPFCFLQIFCIYLYGSAEHSNLAAMAYDRYVCICYPLHYNNIMNTSRVCTIVLMVWIYSLIKCAFLLVISVNRTYCGNLMDKVFCDPNKLVCSTSTAKSTYLFVIGIVSVSVPLIPMSFSYIKILTVCLKNPKEARQKAIKTCTPQIVSLANLVISCTFEILQLKLNKTQIPNTLRTLMSVYLIMCQPLLDPVLYGLNLAKIRNVCKKVFLCRTIKVNLRKKLLVTMKE